MSEEFALRAGWTGSAAGLGLGVGGWLLLCGRCVCEWLLLYCCLVAEWAGEHTLTRRL